MSGTKNKSLGRLLYLIFKITYILTGKNLLNYANVELEMHLHSNDNRDKSFYIIIKIVNKKIYYVNKCS